MTKVTVITNPHSWRNRSSPHLSELCRTLSSYPGVIHHISSNFSELKDIVGRLSQERPDVLILNGGDGTIHHLLSLLYQQTGFADMPLLALMAGGTTNLIAGELGLKVPLAQLLRKVYQEGLGTLHILSKPAMILTHPTIAMPKIGFFFGTAAFTKATIISRRHRHVKAIKSTLSVLLPLIQSVWQAIKMNIGLGSTTHEDQSLYQGYPAKIILENQQSIISKQTLFLATTLSRMSFGLKIFWGKGEGAIRYLSVPFPAFRWLFSIWPILSGRPRSWMIAHDYRSGMIRSITLHIDCPSFFDGEEMPAANIQPIKLGTSPMIPFVSA